MSTAAIYLGLGVTLAFLYELPASTTWRRLARSFLILAVVCLPCVFKHDFKTFLLTGLLLAVVVLERLFPRNHYPIASDDQFRNAAYGALKNGIAAVLGVAGLSKLSQHPVPWGLSAHHVSLWIQVPAAFLVMDFVGYVRHRSTHRFTWLWRTHEIHHAVTEISALSAWGRFNFFEGVVLVGLLPMFVAHFMGAGVETYVYAHTIPNGIVAGLFAHANLDFPRSTSRLAHLINNPRVHCLHHTGGHDHANLGINLMVWDMLFGTYEAPVFVPTAFGSGDRELVSRGILRQHTYAFRGLLSALGVGRERRLLLGEADQVAGDEA